MDNTGRFFIRRWLIVIFAVITLISTSTAVWFAWQSGYLGSGLVSENTDADNKSSEKSESDSVTNTEVTKVSPKNAIEIDDEDEYDIRLTSEVYGTKVQVVLTAAEDLEVNYDLIETIFPNVTVDGGTWEMDMILLSEAYPQSLTDNVELAFNHSQAGDVYRLATHDAQATTYSYMTYYSPEDKCMALGELLDAPCGTRILEAGDVALRIVCRADADDISMCEDVLKTGVFANLTETK